MDTARTPLVLTVVNMKGGSAKTTTAAFIAHALHERGLSVLVVDADPQGSALRWSETGDWPFPVIGLPVRTIHTQLAGLVGARDVTIIDTPPLDAQAGILASALRAATYVVIPTAPTPIEIDRLPAVRAALDDSGPARTSGAPPPAAVLFTRTVPLATSTRVWRDALTSAGWSVLVTEVRRLERIAQAYGDRLTDAASTGYGYVAEELLNRACREASR